MWGRTGLAIGQFGSLKLSFEGWWEWWYLVLVSMAVTFAKTAWDHLSMTQ
jgi:hypothetical protein